MLQAVDRLLGMESVGGTPAEFDIAAVVPVVDIRAAGKTNPSPRYVTSSVSIAGIQQSYHLVFTPPERRLGMVLAAQAVVTFAAPVAAGNEIGVNWSLGPDVPNGADELVGVSGCAEYSNAITTNATSLQYKTMLGGIMGGQGNPPWLGSLKGILWGQSFFASGSAQLALIVDVEYFVANASTPWPAGTTLEFKVWGLDLPTGIILEP